jgi:hypothetical protein
VVNNINPQEGYTPQSRVQNGKEPWTIMTVHTNVTTRIQCGIKIRKINFQRVTPFSEEILI